MKHKHWALIVFAAIILALFAGCAKKTPPPEPPKVETPPEPPIEEPIVEPEPEPTLELKTVFFDYDKHNIKEDQRARLTDNAKQLMKFDDSMVRLEGHCDERGTDAYNMALGEKRAREVKDFLTQYGIAATRLQTVSYGEERPTCRTSNEGCWSRNRRVEFIVIDNQP